MGASASGPLGTIGDFFTPPTTAVDASSQPDSTDKISPPDVAVANSVVCDTGT